MPIRSRLVSGKARATAAAVALLILTPALTPRTDAQETVAEVRRKAQVALAQGAFGDAIGYLQQLVEWFGESKRETTFVQMEVTYYQLGLSHLFVGQFGEARAVFDIYLKKYRTGQHAQEVAAYIGDTYRYENQLPQALKAYISALKKYPFGPDIKADILMSIARCYLAQDKWDKAMPVLLRLYAVAPDFSRRNWAATLLTTAYLKERALEKVYRLVPYLLLPNSFAGRSVALNMAALEAGDDLFADEEYRAALWVYRLVYPHDVIMTRSQAFLDQLEKKAERLKRIPDSPRQLMRTQESIAELEEEIKALAKIDNYDMELHFRIARAYMEIRRFREARDLFLYLNSEVPEPRAEEALFYAFSCAAQIQPWDQAFELGNRYMTEYRAKEYYDRITLTMGQMYAKLEDWPNVIAVLTKALEDSPRHEAAGECMFLIGYASFMEEKFKDAVTWLEKMNAAFPGSPREPDAIYWLGMAQMFDKNFEEAAGHFDAILSRFPDTPYVTDSAFRRAVCEYGMSKFLEAEKMLEAFVATFPDNKLCGEAFMMMADSSANFGELRKAVMRFQQVSRYDVNIEFYNYAAFRGGEILHELQDFAGEVKHFQEYIERAKEGSNIPLAMYNVGAAMWNMNEQRGALEYFRKGIETYGVDRKALGIDLILEEWVGRGRGADEKIAEAAWRDFESLLRKAELEKNVTLALRLKRVFLYKRDITPERHAALLKDIVRAENIPFASPGVLELMLDQAIKQTNMALATQVAEATIRDFTETDYALSARMFIAQEALRAQDYPTAIKHLNVIKEVYASSTEAAEALMLLGDLHIKQDKYDEADACFKNVLGVREWRGPLWPAALFGRGECARLQRKFESATAYYERIYLMYSQYKDWAAKAYLARAECLTRIQQYSKAAETLEEMLRNPDMKDRPELAEATKRLERLASQRSL